jgi:hypothetical protein
VLEPVITAQMTTYLGPAHHSRSGDCTCEASLQSQLRTRLARTANAPPIWPADGEPTCRRGSVHLLAEAGWPSICAAYLGTARFPGRTGRPCPLLGLAPGGVYQATSVTRGAGALLPHRFTLACAVAGHRRSVLCGTFLRVAPTRFASTLPFGAPTFLDVNDAAATQSAHRPPAVLQVVVYVESRGHESKGRASSALARCGRLRDGR